jgi:hypothetical protein
VASETIKPQPAPAVIEWLDRQVVDTLYLTSLTRAELLAGVGGMPDGYIASPEAIGTDRNTDLRR